MRTLQNSTFSFFFVSFVKLSQKQEKITFYYKYNYYICNKIIESDE